MDKSTPTPANITTHAFQGSISQPLELWDQTLRDGEQTPGVAFTREEKLELARALDELGISCLNAGYPAVSEHEAETVRQIVGLGLRARLGVTSRLLKSDVDAAAATGVDWVLPFASLSDWHIKDKLRTTEEAYLKQVYDVVPYGVEKGLDVAFAIEDATRTPPQRLVRFITAAEECGAKAIRICDTLGVLVPSATQRLFEMLRPLVRGRLLAHFHNDLGMATANTITALEAGADGADVALAGLGERAGNTPLEEVVIALAVKYGRDLDMRLDQLPRISKLAYDHARITPPDNKPIVGKNVFSHESGIHVAGVLANPITYEPFPPALVNREHTIVYGKHSGMSGLRHLLQENGLELSADDQQSLLTRVKSAGQDKQLVSPEQVLAWARELRSGGNAT